MAEQDNELSLKKRISNWKPWYSQNKEYRKQKMKEYWAKNKDHLKKIKRENYLKNHESIRAKTKSYRQTHKKFYKDYHREYFKSRMKTDLNFWIKNNLLNRLDKCFKLWTRTGKTRKSDEYGIDYKGIIEHLTKNMPSDFKREDYHVDHIKPLCSFDFTKEEDIRAAFKPENHQWLKKEDNLAKISSDILQRLNRK